MILLHRLRATNFKQMENVDLTFPKSGTLLIEGRNEAGKSTLFEAIFYALYGRLPGEGTAVSAIRYGCSAMEVTLDFSIENRVFSVSRKQGQRATASLSFPGTDGQTERVVTVSGVNTQIIDEMNLSPQGLLNTCFVEQKKLEHLESLNPAQRQTAINELVNLSAFDRMAGTFPTRADEERRENAAKLRLIVAQLDTKHAALQATLDTLRPLHAVALLEEINAAQETCRKKAEGLATRKAAVAAVVALKERQAWITDKVRPALSLWEMAEKAETAVRDAVEQAKNEKKRLPVLEEKMTGLAALHHAVTLHLNLRAEQERHAAWETGQKAATAEVTRLTGVLTQAKQRWDDAQKAEAAAEKHHALTEWARPKPN